jgi:hypothetical protein
MKSRKRGPAPPVVCGPLATLRGLRLTFCSRRCSDLLTPPATRRAPRPPRPRPSPGAVRGIPRPRPLSRVHAPTCSPLHLIGFGQPPTPNTSSASLSRRVPRHPPPAAAPARRRGHRLRSILTFKSVTFSRTTPHHDLLEGSKGQHRCEGSVTQESTMGDAPGSPRMGGRCQVLDGGQRRCMLVLSKRVGLGGSVISSAL